MIVIDHLVKRYGILTAVDDVTFTVQQGEVFALLGPNGSGKTTALKTIVGLNLPTSGSVTVGGVDVHRYPKKARQMISYLPQRVIFPEMMTAREVIRFYGSLRNVSRADADRALEKARFNGVSERAVSEFSGGMVQRLALTITALPDAAVLLLDEPTANLDPHGVIRFRDFIREQKHAGKTILFTTHLLAEAEQLADRIGIFVSGKLAALETVDDVRSASATAGTVEDLYLHYTGDHYDR